MRFSEQRLSAPFITSEKTDCDGMHGNVTGNYFLNIYAGKQLAVLGKCEEDKCFDGQKERRV
jgi:hypothetical protein